MDTPLLHERAETWFEVADPAGSIATISSSLAGKDTHTASFRVYGTPTWFGQRPVQQESPRT